MISEKDLESMGYYDMFPDADPVNWADFYSGWVEKKILTKDQERLIENTLGLVGEAGEVAEKMKKLVRDSTRFSNEEIMKELGDVVFYATALGNIYGRGLQEILELNIPKARRQTEEKQTKRKWDNR